MALSVQNIFLNLVRLAICKEHSIQEDNYHHADWDAIQAIAEQQGLLAIVLDGIENLPVELKPSKEKLLQWIGIVLLDEQQYEIQEKASIKLATLFQKNNIRTYVLKGTVVAECYPKPEHRLSSDLDCYLLPDRGAFDAWSIGNGLVKTQGYKVRTSFYKNSTFFIPGLVVENHKYMVPFRGNKCLENLEMMLQRYMREDKGEDKIEETFLYRPPMMVSSLFLIEHAYSHFLHEGLTWRHVLDWMMFSCKHYEEIDWTELMAYVDEFGFRKFYDSYERLGRYLLGEIQEDELTEKDRMMLADVWAPLDLHESDHGIKGKLALAGNTWRARWKYRHFADISMIHALWIQVKGVLFIKNPTLD